MKKTIERIVAYTVQVAEPDMIILFGSMANHTYNAYSDIDLLIVVSENITKGQIASQVKYFAQDFSISADILVYSKYDIKEAMEFPHSFIAGVLKSGKIIYKKH